MLDAVAVGVAEARRHRAVDVEDAHELTIGDERHDDLGARGGVAGDVIVKCRDVVHYDRLSASNRGTANAATTRQSRACRASAKRPEQQIAGFRREVEACPVDVRQFMVDERGEVGRVCNQIAIAGEQRSNAALELLVRDCGIAVDGHLGVLR
jgi:hypothetical protein